MNIIRTKCKIVDITTKAELTNAKLAKLRKQIYKQKTFIETQGNCKTCGKYDILGNGLCKVCHDAIIGY